MRSILLICLNAKFYKYLLIKAFQESRSNLGQTRFAMDRAFLALPRFELTPVNVGYLTA